MKENLSIRWSFAILILNLFIGFEFASAQDLFTRVTVNTSDKNMNQLLSEIQRKTDLKFVYNPEEVSTVKTSNRSFKNQPLNSVISELGYSAEKSGDNIIISKPEITKLKQGEIKIVGTVTDTVGETLAGVSIMIEGTTKGTSTDLNGNFVLVAPVDAVVGFGTQKKYHLSVRNQV